MVLSSDSINCFNFYWFLRCSHVLLLAKLERFNEIFAPSSVHHHFYLRTPQHLNPRPPFTSYLIHLLLATSPSRTFIAPYLVHQIIAIHLQLVFPMNGTLLTVSITHIYELPVGDSRHNVSGSGSRELLAKR